MLQFSKTAKAGFARPDVWNVEIPVENSGGKHEDIAQNFVDAILDGTPLIAPAEEGVWSVELANAIFEYLEIFHNRQRRHSRLGMLTPVEFETRHKTLTVA